MRLTADFLRNLIINYLALSDIGKEWRNLSYYFTIDNNNALRGRGFTKGEQEGYLHIHLPKIILPCLSNCPLLFLAFVMGF
jgi:hypothetical protein